MKRLFLTLVTLVVVMLFIIPPETTHGASSKKTGLIPIYNPNGGGILASIALDVWAWVYYERPNLPVPDYNIVHVELETSTWKTSFVQCGGTMSGVSPAKVGGFNISLSQDYSDFIGDARRVYDRKKGNNGVLHGSYTVTTIGSFVPDGRSCAPLGSTTVTNSFSFTNPR